MNRVNKGKLVFAAILLVLTLCFIIAALGYDEPKARSVPVLVGIATIILGIFSIIHVIRPIDFVTRFDMSIVDLGKQVDSKEEAEEPLDIKLLGSVAWLAGLFAVTFFLGFHIGIVAFMLAFLKVRGKVGWIKSITAAVLVWGIVYIMFEKAMGFSLFKGLFFGEILPLL